MLSVCATLSTFNYVKVKLCSLSVRVETAMVKL